MDTLSHSMVVGVYQSKDLAQQAINELLADGYMPEQIHMQSINLNDTAASANSKSLESFFHCMTDGDNHNQIIQEYTKVLEAGNTLVSVDTINDLETNKAASLMSQTATFASEHTATSAEKSDFTFTGTGEWVGVKIFKGTKNSFYDRQKIHQLQQGASWSTQTY